MGQVVSVVVVLALLGGVLLHFAPRGVRSGVRGMVRTTGRLARSATATRRRAAVTVTGVVALAAHTWPGVWVGAGALVVLTLVAGALDRRPRIDDAAMWVGLASAAVVPLVVTADDRELADVTTIVGRLPLVAAGSVLLAAACGALVGLGGRRSHGPREAEAHAALGVSRAEYEANRVRMTRTRDGRVILRPVPPASRVRGDLEERVAAIWPGWTVASVTPTEAVLVREGADAAERRAVLASSGGLVAAVEPLPDAGEHRPDAARLVGPAGGWRLGQVAGLEDLAARDGRTLVEVDLDRGVAVAAAVERRTVEVRDRLAGLLRVRPLELEVTVTADAVVVHRGPVLPPDARVGTWTAALDDVLPLPTGERWVVEVEHGRVAAHRQADPLREVQPYPWDVQPSYGAVPFAVDERGELVTLGLIEVNELLGGTPGGGKSGGLTALLAGISRLEHTALIGLDPKRVELSLWAPRFSRVAKAEADALDVLGLMVEEMERRYGWLEERGLKKITPELLSAELPLLVLVIDELADLVSVGVTKEDREADAQRSTMIRRLIAKGRAAGLVVIAATQKPQSDVVPTALRDLIQLRVAYATTNAAMTDTILGAGMAQNGGLAHEISATQRGVCYVVSETSREPKRARTFWVPDDEVSGLAQRTAHLRVELPWLSPAAPAVPEPVVVRGEDVDLGESELSWDDLESLGLGPQPHDAA